MVLWKKHGKGAKDGQTEKGTKRRRIIMNIKKILVPTDFSRYADRALSAALEIAETFDSEVFLVHVIRDGSGFNTLERLDDTMREKVREAVRKSTDAALGNQIKKFGSLKSSSRHKVLGYGVHIPGNVFPSDL